MAKIKKTLYILLACLMMLSLFTVSSTALTDGGVGYTDTVVDWYGSTYAPFEYYMKLEGVQASLTPYTLDARDGCFFALRIVASHKNLSEYKQFGYDVVLSYIEGGETKTKSVSCTGNTVYKKIQSTVNGEVITLDAEKDFSAEYISAVVIYDIPKDAGALHVSVMPSVTFTDSRGTMNDAVKSASVDYWSDKTLSTMTFNIRNWDTSDAHLQRIKTVIKENTPDVIGFQEMSNLSGKKWVDKLLADSEIDAMYGYIGEDRTDGTGEQCAIFYRKDKFSVMESDVFYLYCAHGVHCTNTSCKGVEQAGNFSNAPTEAYNRLFTYARLKRLSDNKELIYMNTHLELSSSTIDDIKLQTKEVDYLINFAKNWIESGYSVILTGDFNAGLTSATCQKLISAGYKSAESESERFIGQELPQGEIYASENRGMARGVDHIFIYSNTCYFDSYKYCDQKITVGGVADYPSDHIPRIATCVIW